MLRLVSIALLLPALALAQRSGMGGMGRGAGGGSGGGRGPGNIAREPGIEIPTPLNAVNLLIQHRPELALTDTQFMRVISIKRALDSTNAPLMRKLDSVQRLFKGAPMFSDPSAQRRDSLATARGFVDRTMANIDDNISGAREKAFALLSPVQLANAEAIEEKARKASAPPGRGAP